MDSVHVLFGGSHLEEVFELSTSEWVVSVLSHDWLGYLRSLDIPEVVVWNVVEYFLFSVGSQTSVIGSFKIFRVIVFSFLEDTKLF